MVRLKLVLELPAVKALAQSNDPAVLAGAAEVVLARAVARLRVSFHHDRARFEDPARVARTLLRYDPNLPSTLEARRALVGNLGGIGGNQFRTTYEYALWEHLAQQLRDMDPGLAIGGKLDPDWGQQLEGAVNWFLRALLSTMERVSDPDDFGDHYPFSQTVEVLCAWAHIALLTQQCLPVLQVDDPGATYAGANGLIDEDLIFIMITFYALQQEYGRLVIKTHRRATDGDGGPLRDYLEDVKHGHRIVQTYAQFFLDCSCSSEYQQTCFEHMILASAHRWTERHQNYRSTVRPRIPDDVADRLRGIASSLRTG